MRVLSVMYHTLADLIKPSSSAQEKLMAAEYSNIVLDRSRTVYEIRIT